jgi:membrane-associated protease RseP (regulator of RpoE activity)
MGLHRWVILAAFTLPTLMPPLLSADPLAAQQAVTVTATSRGMLGIRTQAVPRNSMNARQREIINVVPGSPAERAGLVRGDTIIRINGLSATQQIMNAGFEPGDTVVLRVVRDGREREVSVVAAERTDPISRFEYFSSDMLPDSIRGRMSIIMNAVRADADTIAARRMIYGQLSGDSTMVFRFGTDSIRGFRYERATPMQLDSLTRYFLGSGTWTPGAWSADSTFRFSAEWPHMLRDSVFTLGGGAVIRYGEGGFSFDTDSIRFVRPTEFMASGFVAGLRAVAGAELSELNPGLAEYFGASGGVLVLNAREGTPAERAGLMPGDVILRANAVEVSTIDELRRAIATVRGEPVRLDVLRRGQRLTLTMGDRP